MIIPLFPTKLAVSKGFLAIAPLLPWCCASHPRWHCLWNGGTWALTLCFVDIFQLHRAATKTLALEVAALGQDGDGKKEGNGYACPGSTCLYPVLGEEEKSSVSGAVHRTCPSCRMLRAPVMRPRLAPIFFTSVLMF